MPTDDQNDLFLRDVRADKPILPEDEKLGQLSKLVTQQLYIERQIKETEETLSKLKSDLAKVSEFEIPDLFNELGLQEFRIFSGIKVSVKPYYSGKITSQEAYEWLEQHGHGGIIKGEVSIAFPKGYDKTKLNEIAKAASAVGLFAETLETVHPSTLRAWIKETIETGGEIDRTLFNIYEGMRTKLSV
jgi:hypothetical protein